MIQDKSTYAELVGDTGLEHPPQTPAKPQNPGSRGTKSGTLGGDFPPNPAPDVADLAARLAVLPKSAREALAAALAAK